MNKYKIYIQLCKKRGVLILFALGIMMINAIVTIKIPFALNNVINTLMNINNIYYNQFINYFIFFIGLYIIQQMLSYISTLLFKKIGNGISIELAELMYKKIFFSIKKNPPQVEVGNVVVGLDRDCFSIGENGILLLYNFLNLMINIIGLFYFMWVTNYYLCISITLVFIILIIIQKKYNKYIEQTVTEGRVLSGEYTYYIQGLANNFEEYRRNKSYNYLNNKYNIILRNLLEKRYQFTKMTLKSTLTNGIGSLVNTAIVLLGGSIFVLNNQLNLSNLITFNTYSNTFGGYLTQVPSLFMQAKTFKVSYKKVCEILDIECFNEYQQFLLNEKEEINEIEFVNLGFSYDSRTEIFSDFNKKFEKGNIYCISGENGVGKTTFLSLLTGEYSLTEGYVKINGVDIDLFDYKLNFDSFVSYMSSKAILINDSIFHNISFDKEYDILKIKHLAEILCIDDWINNLPNGYDTKIDDSNLNLSSGQKQKIALIRTLIQDTQILILDEFEKHLDERAKENVINYLQSIKKDKIIIIVTHDEKIKAKCDINLFNLERVANNVK